MTSTATTAMTPHQVRITRLTVSRALDDGYHPKAEMETIDTWFPEGKAITGVLQCFEGCEALRVRGRNLNGFVDEQLELRPTFNARQLMRSVLVDVAFRLHPIRPWVPPSENLQAAAIVLWKLPSAFERIDGESRHRVDVGARKALVELIGTLPEPSALIEAGPEVVAIWRLKAPLPMADGILLHQRLIALYGGDVSAAADPATFSIPICGPVRNWNNTRPDYTAISLGDPTRRFDASDLLRQS